MKRFPAAALAAFLLLAGCQEQVTFTRSPAPDPPVTPAPEEPDPEPGEPQRINAYAHGCLKITAVDTWPKIDPGGGTSHVWENVCDQEIIVIACQDSYTLEGPESAYGVERRPGGGEGTWGTQRDCGTPGIGPDGRVLEPPPWFYNSSQSFYNRYSLPLKAAGSAYGVKTYVQVQSVYRDPFGSWTVTYRYGVCYADTENYQQGWLPTIISDADGNYSCWIESE